MFSSRLESNKEEEAPLVVHRELEVLDLRGFGVRVEACGSRTVDAGFGVWGLGFRFWGFRVQGSGFRVSGFRVQGFRVQGSGFQGSGFQGSGFRVQIRRVWSGPGITEWVRPNGLEAL